MLKVSWPQKCKHQLLQQNVNEIERRISEQTTIVEKAQARIVELNAEIDSLSTELSTVSEAHEQVAEEHRELNERSKSLREDRAGIKAALEQSSAKRESSQMMNCHKKLKVNIVFSKN